MEGNRMMAGSAQPLELLVANDAVAMCEKLEIDFRNRGDYCHNNIGSKTSDDWERMDKFLVDAANEIRSVHDCVKSLVALYSRQSLRQCDVGTPEEQGERCLAQFEQWRRNGDGKKLITAIMTWAQMPYKAERKGEGDGSK